MFTEEVELNERKVAEMNLSLDHALKSNNRRGNCILRMIKDRWQYALRTIFRTWRMLTRQKRLLEITNRNKMKRFLSKQSRLLLSVAFYQWKLILEMSRNTFLMERLHESAFQLENAKNQFQLQCCRADRLIQITKDAKRNLEEAKYENKELQEQVESLKEEMASREDMYKEKLASGARDTFRLVSMYSRFSSLLIRTSRQPLSYQLSSASRPNRENADELDSADPDDPLDQTDTWKLLPRWYNSILKEIKGSPTKTTETRNGDFASGEVFYILLNYVFEKSPELLNRRMATMERFQEIKKLCEEYKLTTILEPEDFINMREDRIMESLCEIYERYIDDKWRESTSKASIVLKEGIVEKEPEIPVDVTDFSEFNKLVQQSEDQLKELQNQITVQNHYEQELVTHKMAISETRSYLERERNNGVLLTHLSKSNAGLFWSLNPKNFREILLSNNIQIRVEAIIESLEAALKTRSLQTSRLFHVYASKSTRTMAEFSFWRFIEFSTLLSDSLTKEMVSDIFDRVVSPQLVSVLNPNNKRKLDLDRKALIRVARQEMDIRYVTPEQFIELLVWMISEKYGIEHGIEEKFSSFFTQMRFPRKGDLPSVLEEFYEYDTQRVIEFFSTDLCRIFFFYLKRQETSNIISERNMAVQNGGRFGTLLTTSFFLRILEDCGFLSDGINLPNNAHNNIGNENSPQRFISSNKVLEMLHGLQSYYVDLKANQVTFTIFLESFSLIAHYWCPNPLVPLSRKVAAFIVVCINQLNTFHTGTTLILAEFSHIPLTGGKRVDFNVTNASDM
ncbi:unnamed protein product [Phytomonas sp. Hart1]|nr:unnamed protein product [Phytomonas sp. Hart1]|eukprot:CCW69785.1 unnamed protein product [Phytomonas sp. isolate Hart1]